MQCFAGDGQRAIAVWQVNDKLLAPVCEPHAAQAVAQRKPIKMIESRRKR